MSATERPVAAAPSSEPSLWRGFAFLSVVYVVWGSTYLAIRVAVREGSGFPPLSMSASRVLTAGAILFLWSRLSGRRVRPTREEFVVLAGSGLLLWSVGNGLLTWSEQHAASGYAALIVGTAPIWAAVIEAVQERRLPRFGVALSLLVGFAGIGLLSLPVLRQGGRADLLSMGVLLTATIGWATGSVIVSRGRIDLSTRSSAALQQLVGGAGLALGALALGEPAPHPTPQALGAWVYLILFGSLIGFTSFINALRLLPTNIAMTYAYVNPVIAVFLGWLILSESITVWTLVGAACVLAGVAGVIRVRRAAVGG